jgi:hypothetical protein
MTQFVASASIYSTKDNAVYVTAGAPDASLTIVTLDDKETARITGH